MAPTQAMQDDQDRISFLNDCLNKLDAQVTRITAEREQWRSILVSVVGEQVAEMKYREATS